MNLNESGKGSSARLDSEAISLFGRHTVEKAKRLHTNQMAAKAEQVAEGARQLREQAGNPEGQRAIIKDMDEGTALALCRWIIGPDFRPPHL